MVKINSIQGTGGIAQVYAEASHPSRIRIACLPEHPRHVITQAARTHLSPGTKLSAPNMHAVIGLSQENVPIAAQFSETPQGKLAALQIPPSVLRTLNLKEFQATYPHAVDPVFLEMTDNTIKVHRNQQVESLWENPTESKIQQGPIDLS